ncbi:MAG: DUF58 domain-containing protein [Bryobacteraceae bacterium]|nr:DUF58 domain-containing protein [Bryobacteraceae bacterium]
MMDWWRDPASGARRWLEHRMRERITTRGILFLAAALLVGGAGFASGNNLLFLLLAAMMSVLVVSSFLSRLGLAGLELEIRLPEHVCARQSVPARLVLRNVKKRMPSFSIRLSGADPEVFPADLYFPVIPGGAAVETTVEARFPRRGLHAEDSFVFSTTFPFGFAERRARVTMRQDLLVYPSLEPQPGFDLLLAEVSGDAEALFRGLGHDFYRIRPYIPFESARHVDWRATAKTGELQVREFAREQEHLITLVLDLEVPPGQDEWFERALECCAWLAWRFAARGARIRFRSQHWETLVPVENDVYAILKYLALVEPRRRAAALRPLDEPTVAVVFSASPARLEEHGWVDARIVAPGHWAVAGAARS